MSEHKSQDELEKIIESLEKKVHELVLEDREGQFLVDHKGKEIVLDLIGSEEVCGELIDIDNKRITIQSEAGREVMYYKHAIKAYYLK